MYNISNEKTKEVVLNINGKKFKEIIPDNIEQEIKLPDEVLQLIHEINEGKSVTRTTSPDLNLDELTEGIDFFNQAEKTIIVLDFEKKNKVEKDNIFGIEIGKTSRLQVMEMMEKYGDTNLNKTKKYLNYQNLGFTVNFNINDIVDELNIIGNYEWSTIKGLQIGDNIDKAIKLYGQPKMRSFSWALWEGMTVFIEDSIIRTIRLQK